MPDINTMLNAAYDAYDKVKAEVTQLRQMLTQLTEENVKLREELGKKPATKAKKRMTRKAGP